MFSPVLSERIDALIDDLILDGGVQAAALASILLASRDSLQGDYLMSLSRRVWTASSELKAGFAIEQARRRAPRIAGRTDPQGARGHHLCRKR